MNQEKLLEWYEKEKRILPFRLQRDPYKIWISEIMSQQTRIEAMLGHYERFIQLFPDIEALSGADDDQLMKAWQGLGYYSRARNLKKAAQVCMEEYGGQLPDQYEKLLQLPGIGEYTAGSIASIAFEQRVPAIDGNVIRVYSRFYRLEEDFSKTPAKKMLRKLAENDLPEERHMPAWTQALMELGARVCTPSKADCSSCPLSDSCQSAFREDALALPVRKKKEARKQETMEIVIQAAKTEKGWALKISQRPEKGLLAGLYEFGSKWPDEYSEKVDLGQYTHLFTHREWIMHGWLVICPEEEGFTDIEDIEALSAIPSAFMPFYRKAVEYLYE